MDRVSAGRLVVAFSVACGFGLPPDAARGGALQTAVFTELGGKVWVIERDQGARAAVLRATVGGRSTVKTADRSRVEMEFADHSLVRLGSHATFAFQQATREMKLDEGAMLLRVPKGVGGVTTVRTAAATAAITGTTVLVSASKGGGFRMVVLEGVAEVTYADGARVRCRSGDMTMRPAGEPGGGTGPSQIHLEGLMGSAGLVTEFRRELPSLALIRAAIQLQSERLAAGNLQETGRTFGASTLEPSGDRDRIRSLTRKTGVDPLKDLRDTRPRDNYTGPK